MKSKGKRQLTGSQAVSGDDAFSDEWFTRYLLDAVFLVILLLPALGIALYFDAGAYLRDGSQEPGAGFLACMVLVPALGVVTLALALSAGIRLFSRPRTLGHAFVRFALLVAHLSVFLVCADTVSSTATALLAGSYGQSSSSLDPTENWRAMAGRDYVGSPSAERDGPPDGMSSPPSFGLGAPGLGMPGGGASSR